MQKIRCSALLLLVGALSQSAQGTGDWRQVELIQNKGDDCKSKGQISTAMSRLFYSVTDDALEERTLVQLRVEAHALGANALIVKQFTKQPWKMTIEAEAFLCQSIASSNIKMSGTRLKPGNRLLAKHRPNISREMRLDKFYNIAVDGGIGVAPARTAGLSFGYFLAGNQIAEFKMLTGAGKENTATFKKDHSADAVALKLKWFTANSFFASGGLGYRRYRITLLNAAGNKAYSIRGDTLIADIAVGNQWQFQNLSIGITWVGLMIKMLDLKSSEAKIDNQYIAEQAALVKDAKRDVFSTTPQIARLSFGWSF